jgi:hypothetical protein
MRILQAVHFAGIKFQTILLFTDSRRTLLITIFLVSWIPTMSSSFCFMKLARQFTLLALLRSLIFQKAPFIWLCFKISTFGFNSPSNWARVTRTCKILKLQNMDEEGCYVHLHFSYDKLSSLRLSNMSERSLRHVRGTRFGCIRRDLEYAFTPLFVFLSPPPPCRR